MYYKVQDFLNDWDLETESTLKILNNLTDQSLNQRVTEQGRKLGRLAWHLIGSMSEMGALAGLTINKIEDKYIPGVSAKEIAETYSKAAAEVKTSIMDSWKDENMKDELNMYGETWTKGMTLDVVIKHQIHHRGQMTVLMRQAGLKVPGICGPSKEEWAAMGMPAME